MRKTRRHLLTTALLPFFLVGLLSGCGSDSDSSPPRYRIELTNLTANQPLAPIAVILHGSGYAIWQIGQTAGNGLEQLAESGDPSMLLAEANANNATYASQAGSGVVGPGAAERFELSGAYGNNRLTVASMLVNTNDAYTGIANADLSRLAIGESRQWNLATYDAGTEFNSETAGTVPGPAGGGEGYNPLRDDRNYVAIHPGVVSSDDGLATSALDESHRFLNPSSRLVVTRLN